MPNKIAETSASPVDISRIQSKLASWLISLVLLVFLVIIWGGLVRLTGSGLSIPDWPMINGSLLPPTSNEDWQTIYAKYEIEFYQVSDLTLPAEMPMSRFKTMFAIEYIHRSLVAIIGLLFLVVVIKSLRHREIWRQTRGLLITTAVLLLGQAILGGVVVKQELRAELVAIHLGIAFLFLSLLLWAALHLSRPKENVMNSTSKLSSLAWLGVVALWIQVVIGGLTAGTKAGLIFNSFPKMGDYLIPPLNILVSSAYGGFLANLAQNQILIQFIHRWWAFVALILVIALVVKG